MTQGMYGQGEQTLSKAAGMVAEAKADFDRMAQKLDGQIQGMRNQWVGQGGAAFFALHQAWTEKQRVIVTALDEFEASLTRTEKDNVSTDQEQSSGMSRLTSRLS